MPDCPTCKVIIGLCEIGCICPQCRKVFTPMELHSLPDYNFLKAFSIMNAFIRMMDFKMVDSQIYYIDFVDGGTFILPLGITYN